MTSGLNQPTHDGRHGVVGTIAGLWRYPVKSMGGEELGSALVDQRAVHADRLWAVRDLELNAVTTARRLPRLLGCSARFVTEPPPGVGPGDVVDVAVTFPDGSTVESTDPKRMNDALSELVGKPVALVSLPPLKDKAAYRGVLAKKTDIRRQWDLGPDEPLPDFTMFPIRKMAELAIYATPIGIFADAYPLHILTTSSLAAMAEHGGNFDVRRFRPNILVKTSGTGLLEQEWLGGVLLAGDAAVSVEIPAIRCSVPLREQPGLSADPAVVKILSRHADRCLGVYADIASGGMLRVGDEVRFTPPQPSALGGAVTRLADRLRRGTIRTGTKLMPR